mgnify:CR=1 FL=1
MAQWNLARMPAHVHNAQALDAWYGKLPPEGKAKLEWAFADLMVGDESDATRFPPYLQLGDVRLAVRYRFEPGAPDDGMTVVVPLHLLNALDAERELFNAELDLTQTKRNELLSLVQLYKALGGGWQQ